MKIAVVFPGYASKKIGMTKELYDNSRSIQELFEVAGNCLPINFVKLCFASSEAELTKMQNTWPVLYLVGKSLYTLLENEEIKPTLFAGYNIGFFTAACAAKTLTLPDGLYILNKYVGIYKELLEKHSFVCRRIDGISVDDVSVLCERYAQENDRAYVSTFDAEKACRVVGSELTITKLEQELSAFSGIVVEEDSLAHELHCPLAQSCVESLAMYLTKIDVKKPTSPILLSTRSMETDDPEELYQEMIERIVKPVRWDRSIRTLRTMDVIILIGHEDDRLSSLSDRFSSASVFSLNTFTDLEHISKSIQNLRSTQESIDESKQDESRPDQTEGDSTSK